MTRIAQVFTGARMVWREAPWSEGPLPSTADLHAAARRYASVAQRKTEFERVHGRLDSVPAVNVARRDTSNVERKTRSDTFASPFEAEIAAKALLARRGGRVTMRRVGDRWMVE
jgi:hypothetical protein